MTTLQPQAFHASEAGERKTIAYAGVASHDQKDDLERPKQVREVYAQKVFILNREDGSTFGEAFAQNMLEIITVFSARLYGSRSGKNQKILETCTKAVGENT